MLMVAESGVNTTSQDFDNHDLWLRNVGSTRPLFISSRSWCEKNGRGSSCHGGFVPTVVHCVGSIGGCCLVVNR